MVSATTSKPGIFVLSTAPANCSRARCFAATSSSATTKKLLTRRIGSAGCLIAIETRYAFIMVVGEYSADYFACITQRLFRTGVRNVMALDQEILIGQAR